MAKVETVILTNICLIYDEDKILVQDRKKEDWPGLTFPGGHVEPKESFHDSVIREVKEETGLTISQPVLCGIEEFKCEKADRYIMLYYKCNRFTGELKSSNEGEVFWLERSKLSEYPLSLDLERILEIMESPDLSELLYYRDENDNWTSKICR